MLVFLTTQLSMMFRLNKRLDSANTVELTSFNHRNEESASSSQDCVQTNGVQKTIGNHVLCPREIIGPTGTVRGFKNMIKERKECLRVGFVGKSLEEKEEGKIIVYTTSMGGIRSKVEECAYVKKLFDNLGLKVDERNIFMHKDYQNQLDKRLGIQNASVPYVFVNGASLGGVQELEQMNETGELKRLLQSFERRDNNVCHSCGGFRYINCTQCHGSRRSRTTRISRQISVLRCTACNENGLQRCSECSSSM